MRGPQRYCWGPLCLECADSAKSPWSPPLPKWELEIGCRAKSCRESEGVPQFSFFYPPIVGARGLNTFATAVQHAGRVSDLTPILSCAVATKRGAPLRGVDSCFSGNYRIGCLPRVCSKLGPTVLLGRGVQRGEAPLRSFPSPQEWGIKGG